MPDDLPPPLPPPPIPPAAPPRPPGDDTLMLVLCYVGLLAAIPYLTAKPPSLVRWHARQGLTLALLELFCAGLGLVPFLGFIGHLGLAAALVASVVGIVKALDRAEWRMPVVADVADRLDL